MNKLIPVMSALALLAAVPAYAGSLNLTFTITGDADGTGGSATGEIVGLQDNSSLTAASSLFIDSVTGGVGGSGPFPLALPYDTVPDATNSGINEFATAGGAVTNAFYVASDGLSYLLGLGVPNSGSLFLPCDTTDINCGNLVWIDPSGNFNLIAGDVSFSAASAVPEPAMLGLLGLGLAGLGLARRKRKH